jgi:hypothetical protein
VTDLATVATALAAECRLHAICADCERVQQIDLQALVDAGWTRTPLVDLPLRCRCGSRRCSAVVSGRAYRW